MKKLATLVLAVILVTGCNAMKPNMEETQLLSKEIEKRIYAQVELTKTPVIKEAKPTPSPIVGEQEDEAPPAHSEPAAATKPMEELQPENPVLTEKLTKIEPAPQSDKSTQESVEHHEQAAPQQAEHREENRAMIVWPYPAITCLPEPSPTPEPEWPHITAPEPPTYTPELDPIEPPTYTPTPQPPPAVSADLADPIPEPTEQPANPTPQADPTSSPVGGYAVCSCGAMLTPEEVLPHMKAHAMSGENHSYRAY